MSARSKTRRGRAITKGRPDRAYVAVLDDVAGLVESARATAVRSVNAVMTTTYWLVGRRIVEGEQQGKGRADYGTQLVERLAEDLTLRFGRGFGRRNLALMRSFFLEHREILQTVSAKSAEGPPSRILQMSSGESVPAGTELPTILRSFPLPWSHYVRLLSVKKPHARAFYEAEALRGGWTHSQLDRQIQSQFYERTGLSKNKKRLPAEAPDVLTPEDTIKSPFVLEFLDLRDEYSELELEDALIKKLEVFLLELGGEFTFVGRQRRLRVGDEWYRVDLLLFHRTLRCLVVVDLKLGKFSHADAGQMHLYLNYAREHWVLKGENPPIGLILCAEKDHAVARYALDGLPNKVLAAEYRTVLPGEARLAEELQKMKAAWPGSGPRARQPAKNEKLRVRISGDVVGPSEPEWNGESRLPHPAPLPRGGEGVSTPHFRFGSFSCGSAKATRRAFSAAARMSGPSSSAGLAAAGHPAGEPRARSSAPSLAGASKEI